MHVQALFLSHWNGFYAIPQACEGQVLQQADWAGRTCVLHSGPQWYFPVGCQLRLLGSERQRPAGEHYYCRKNIVSSHRMVDSDSPSEYGCCLYTFHTNTYNYTQTHRDTSYMYLSHAVISTGIPICNAIGCFV